MKKENHCAGKAESKKQKAEIKPKRKETEAAKKAPWEPQRDSRASLPRMLTIYGRLQDEKPVNCPLMAELLEVSPKVIKEDIGEMQNGMKLPIEFDFKRNTYYFYEPVDHFPALGLTEQELFAVFIINPAREMYKGTQFGKVMDASFRKVLGRLDDEHKIILENLDAEFSFRPFGPEDIDIDMIATLRGAIRDRRRLEFEHMKPEDDKYVLRYVDPYHVMLCDGAWYLFTYDHGPKAIRKFRISRIGTLKVLNERFVFPKDFSVKKLLAKCFGIKSGTENHKVIVDLTRWVTRIIGKRRLNAMSKRDMLPDGGSQLTFDLDCLDEIERWLLYWGDEVTVRENDALKKRLCDTARKILAKYEPENSENKK